jgi:hypothetical protein
MDECGLPLIPRNRWVSGTRFARSVVGEVLVFCVGLFRLEGDNGLHRQPLRRQLMVNFTWRIFQRKILMMQTSRLIQEKILEGKLDNN